MHPHVLCQWGCTCVEIPFVLPLSFSSAVPGGTQHNGDWNSGGHRDSPARCLRKVCTPRAPTPLVAWGWGGAGSCQEPAGPPAEVGCGARKRFTASRGGRDGALSNHENCNCSPLSVQGKGRMLPWRLSMVLLNQADRFWLLLSLCWFFFLFFFLFSHWTSQAFSPSGLKIREWESQLSPSWMDCSFCLLMQARHSVFVVEKKTPPAFGKSLSFRIAQCAWLSCSRAVRDIFSSAFGIWESCAGVSRSGQNRLGSLTAQFRWIFWIDTCWVHNPSDGTAAPWPGCAYCCVNVMNTQPCKPSLRAQVGEVWILHENFSHAYLRGKK